MSKIDDLELVVRLALLTEHRDPAEQRALLNVAADVESIRNGLTVTNQRPAGEAPCRLVDQVLASGRDDNGGLLATSLAPKKADSVRRHRQQWELRRTGGPEAAWPANPQ